MKANNLTRYEMDVVPSFVKILKKSRGVENAITSRILISKLNGWHPNGIRMSDVRVRKIINYIRINRMVKNLIASSKGYYRENDKERVQNYASSLKNRARSIMVVANSYHYGKKNH